MLSLAALSAASLTAVGFTADAPLIRHAFGLTEVGVGAIASAIYVGAAITSVAAGRSTDRLGPGLVLAAAMIALAAGAAVCALSPVSWLFFAGVALAGLGYGAVNPPTNVLADTRTSRRRGLSISVKQTGVPLGGIVAGLVVPAVSAHAGWRVALTVPIATCVIVAIFAALLRRPATAPQRDPAPGHRDVVRLRVPRAFTFGFFMAGVQTSIFTFLAVYLVDMRAMSPAAAGAGVAFLLAGGLIGRPAWGWLSDRMHADRTRVLQVAAAVSAALLALLPHVGSAGLPGVLFGMGLCSVGWNGVFVATVSEAVEANLVGVTTGRSMLYVNLGAAGVPPIIGLVAGHRTNWTAAWSCCAVLSLLSAVILQVSRVRVLAPSGLA